MMIWSEYQSTIYNELKSTDRNLAIIARAGSGKSTVLEECNRRVSKNMEVVNTAFNKDIADSLRRRLPFYRTVGTMNSLGWQAAQRARLGPLNANKTFDWLQSKFPTDNDRLFWKIQGPIRRIVSLFKQLNLQSFPEDWNEITDTYGIELEDIDGKTMDVLIDWLERAFAYSINDTTVMDFDDQIYQVIHRDLLMARYDLAFVDEMQDLSPMQIAFVDILADRKITVGDDRQAIYVFRGADIHAVDNIIKAFDSKRLPLSICYRCPMSVIKAAQHIVPDIEPGPDAKEGLVETINKDQWSKLKAAGELVTCRTTTPLVKECLNDLRSKRRAFVRGREIGEKIYELICKVGNGVQTIEVFLGLLSEYHTKTAHSLNQRGRETEAQLLYDKVETIRVLAEEDVATVDDLIAKLESVFSDTMDSRTAIEYSTIHKVKGQERDTVYRLRSDLCPHVKTPEHLMEIEWNIKYVEITRSMNRLYTVLKDRNER